METFGQSLRRLRTESGLSQSKLAVLVPVSQSALSRYEADRHAVDLGVAARLDELLGAHGELAAMLSAAAVHDACVDRDRLRFASGRPRSVDHASLTALAGVLASAPAAWKTPSDRPRSSPRCRRTWS